MHFNLKRSFRTVGMSTRDMVMERSRRDERMLSIVQFLDRAEEVAQAGGYFQNADGIYYRDTRQPFFIADGTQITGTAEALATIASYSSLIANYFTVGKSVKQTLWGKLSTGTTPGNLTVTVRFGTTTGGTSLGASAATALTASKTNITSRLETYVTCRGAGTSGGTPTGSLIAFGEFRADGTGAVITSPGNPIMIPAATQTATNVDTTTAQGIVHGFTLSGAATCTYTPQIFVFEALN